MDDLLSDVTVAEWLSLPELAERYGVSPHVIYALNKQGLPRIRCGRQVRYRLAEVEAWFDAKHRRGDLLAAPGSAT